MYTPQSTCLCIPLANYTYTTTVQSMMYTHNRFHTKFPVIISCLYIRYTHCTCTNNQRTRICVHEKKFTIYIIHVIVFLTSASQNIKTMNTVLRNRLISEIFFWEQSKGFKSKNQQASSIPWKVEKLFFEKLLVYY